MTHVVLAYDAGPDAGMGHQRRMEALAAALTEAGAVPELVSTEDATTADTVVVDSYRWRADDRDRFRAGRVAALDDLDRDLAVDLVVDPSPGSSPEVHRAAGRVLAGPEYALLPPDLRCLPTEPVADVRRVLVATGAADRAGTGARIADELSVLLPAVAVQLAVGPWGAEPTRPAVGIVRTDKGLGPALAEADMVVTAAGVTLLEALVLGRPTVVVVLAENQRRAGEGAAASGAAVLASVDGAAEAAARLAADIERRQELARAARRLVDGLGAARVAAAVLALG